MLCRRCNSTRLLSLAIMRRGDNPVLRCLDCGFLFSPARPADTTGPAKPTGSAGPAGPANQSNRPNQTGRANRRDA